MPKLREYTLNTTQCAAPSCHRIATEGLYCIMHARRLQRTGSLERQDRSTGFVCPKCSSTSTNVTDSRPTAEGRIRRRRECESCETRFTTFEVLETETSDALRAVLFAPATSALNTFITEYNALRTAAKKEPPVEPS